MPRTIRDVIAEVINELNETDRDKDTEIICNRLKALIEELSGRGVSGKEFSSYSIIELADIQGTLSILQASLELLLPQHERTLEIHKKIVELKEANLREPIIEKLKGAKGRVPTMGDIDAELTRQLFKDSTKTVFKKERYQSLKAVFGAAQKTISACQVKIRALSSLSINAGNLNNGVDFPFNDPSYNAEVTPLDTEVAANSETGEIPENHLKI